MGICISTDTWIDDQQTLRELYSLAPVKIPSYEAWVRKQSHWPLLFVHILHRALLKYDLCRPFFCPLLQMYIKNGHLQSGKAFFSTVLQLLIRLKNRRPNDLLLALPQDYVAELLLERGPRGRGLLRDSITHPYHVLLSRCKGSNSLLINKKMLQNPQFFVTVCNSFGRRGGGCGR